MVFISYHRLYEAFHEKLERQEEKERLQSEPKSRFQKFIQSEVSLSHVEKNGFYRMQRCRDALNAIDSRGWNRSFHQRMFHDQFIRACVRVFFKTDPPGTFARSHQAILDQNHWENLSQEVLISTPRRFGKTISVSMFAAAMVFSTPSLEVSIYSTCKRISQKLLRNVQKFLTIIYEALGEKPMKEIRSNMEEVVLQGCDGTGDVRTVNSYPSKVKTCPAFPSKVGNPV